MSSLAPGQRIEARCTRCRDVTGHVIVALVDGQVAKVECCACGSVHKYYPPEAPAREAKSRAVRVQSGRERGEAVLAQARKEPKPKAPPKAKAPSRAEQQTARLQAELERQWQDALARNPATPVPYSMNGTFALGGLVDHPTFGVGMVLALTPPDKMEILFREGVKALRCQC
ncbi:MAG TPA: hypothetical protein H9962_08870 [Candidatus Mailhella merdigallinarum]|uniref:Uncharacterized protein n=1 Tax=Candidatus Mailhella merdigallinarum TaxID=2838658 RepID=A0A9D2HDT4_9BACT|nr:hypothetical protein [Candidatus Mailhella merdigallinarum]